ncbi:MAG: ATP-grasp domain-containing protein [bacterium]|nr:ATP-grasp domain-containing protein [bacterium]
MSSDKGKLMILGAGKFQISIIKLAKQMGFETVVVSAPGNYPGFSIADKSYEVDVREKEVILEIAKKERIQGIVTDQTDLPVPTVAYVAEKMGLPGIGYECALNISNKIQCRNHCKRIGFPVPEYFQASTFEQAQEGAKRIGFPLVVKPSDSQGARGVSMVNDSDALANKFHNALAYSATKTVLLEEFFAGMEINVVGFVTNFVCTNLVIGRKEHFDLPYMFISKKGIFPAPLAGDLKRKIVDLNCRLFESLGPKFGIIFGQYKVNEETGEICLMEAAIRSPGNFTSSHLVPLVCGIDVLPLLIELVSGIRGTVKIAKSKPRYRVSGWVHFYLPEGRICRVNGINEIKSLPGVQKVELDDLYLGVKTERIKDTSGRWGPIIFAGKDRQDCENVVQRIKKALKIEVKTPEGIRHPIWD